MERRESGHFLVKVYGLNRWAHHSAELEFDDTKGHPFPFVVYKILPGELAFVAAMISNLVQRFPQPTSVKL